MFFVYIMADKKHGALYVGQTFDLFHRVYQHKNKTIPGHTKDRGCDQLVWFETHLNKNDAFIREQQLKKWNRNWKIDLIENANPYWDDLSINLTRDAFAETKWQGQQVRANQAAYKAALEAFLKIEMRSKP